MTDLYKLGLKLLEDIPEAKKKYEEDTKWREKRMQQYIENGLDEDAANLNAWDDYWKMANKRDGGEFSIKRI